MRKSAVLLLLFALLPAEARAFTVRQTRGPATLLVRSELGQPAVALSELIHLTLSVEAGEGLQVEPPAKLLTQPLWSVVRRGEPTTKPTETGTVRWQQSFTLAPLAPGTQPLEVAPLRYRDRASDWRQADWEPMSVNVETQIKDADPRHLRDITAVETLPAGPERAWSPWLWLAVPLALLAGAGLFLLWRRRTVRRAESPEQVALRELDRLLARGLPEQGRGKQCVMLLTGIVRRYLEKSLELPARRRTTRELTELLAASRLTIDERQALQSFFERADPVKYAPPTAAAATCAALAEDVRRFLQSVKKE